MYCWVYAFFHVRNKVSLHPEDAHSSALFLAIHFSCAGQLHPVSDFERHAGTSARLGRAYGISRLNVYRRRAGTDVSLPFHHPQTNITIGLMRTACLKRSVMVNGGRLPRLPYGLLASTVSVSASTYAVRQSCHSGNNRVSAFERQWQHSDGSARRSVSALCKCGRPVRDTQPLRHRDFRFRTLSQRLITVFLQRIRLAQPVNFCDSPALQSPPKSAGSPKPRWTLSKKQQETIRRSNFVGLAG